MILYTKFSNERSREFRIRTEIWEEEGELLVKKMPEEPEAAGHIRHIYDSSLRLGEDLKGTGLFVNRCALDGEGLCFEYLRGETLEEALDQYLEKNDMEGLTQKIREYFSLFSEGGEPFEAAEDFKRVFGEVFFETPQTSRTVSDIDMIFSNVIQTEDRWELVDYEWTFFFPVPVKYLQYRCLYYYILGNTRRERVLGTDLYRTFGITKEEQMQFASMEEHFQQYQLGQYRPYWTLYEEISQGVIDARELVKQESQKRDSRTVEVYFDDGRGFGAWNCRFYRKCPPGRVALSIEVPEGTRQVRIDPCTGKSLVRLENLRAGGTALKPSSNGRKTAGGAYVFDTEDPQFIIRQLPEGTRKLQLVFRAEPLEGLVRDVVLGQQGRLEWMEQTRAWKLYRKLRKALGKKEPPLCR